LGPGKINDSAISSGMYSFSMSFSDFILFYDLHIFNFGEPDNSLRFVYSKYFLSSFFEFSVLDSINPSGPQVFIGA
jgi:hypothetical protein